MGLPVQTDSFDHMRYPPVADSVCIPLLSFYSFRNLAKAESDQVKMQVRFKIGNSNEERTTRPFVINKEGNILHGVKSGYVYRLVVNMTIIGDKVETELLCYTRDWLNNTISIPMEDNCKRVK